MNWLVSEKIKLGIRLPRWVKFWNGCLERRWNFSGID